MRYAPVTQRLAGLGSDKWEVHVLARRMKAAGEAVIELTIGEPDAPTPPALVDTAARAMAAGRTGYSNGRGEPALLQALAARYLTKDRIFRMAIIPEGQTLAQAMPSGTDANAAQQTAKTR